jgi:hypothetical protein
MMFLEDEVDVELRLRDSNSFRDRLSLAISFFFYSKSEILSRSAYERYRGGHGYYVLC